MKSESWRFREFTLTSGTKALKGGLACISTATGNVTPGATATTLVPIGFFDQTVDATAAALPVRVRLFREVEVYWMVNDGTVLQTHVGSDCYLTDDQTVSATVTGRSKAGRVWAVDSVKGVAIERL